MVLFVSGLPCSFCQIAPAERQKLRTVANVGPVGQQLFTPEHKANCLPAYWPVVQFLDRENLKRFGTLACNRETQGKDSGAGGESTA